MTDGRTDRQTDGQTDGIAIAYARLAYMLSRAKTIPFYRDRVVLLQLVVHPSVRLSVRPSVTLMYRGRMCWVSSRLATLKLVLNAGEH